MTAKEIQRRNIKAESLKVLQSEDGKFFVESEKGKVLYNVVLGNDANTCTCGDYSTGTRKDKNHQCKHILAVMNAIPKKSVESAQFCERPVPRLDDRFMINIKGKDFILYAGVLDLATQNGLLKLEVELIQFPSKENGMEAICRAVAEGKSGQTFADIGDANPNNCASMIAKHLIRMASTRAKARALRDMCNIGIAAVEELADFDDVIGTNAGKTVPKPQPKAAKKPAVKVSKKAPAKNGEPSPKGNGKQEPKAEPKAGGIEPKTESNGQDKSNQPNMSEAQKRAIYNLSRRRGVSVEELEKMSLDTYHCELVDLNSKDASTFIRNLQQAA
jgi:predicted nucleic acid-binding Zn finger protein